MSPALTRSSTIWHFEGSDPFEVCDEITFDFYPGLPHLHLCTLNQLKSVGINPPEECNWLRMKNNYKQTFAFLSPSKPQFPISFLLFFHSSQTQ